MSDVLLDLATRAMERGLMPDALIRAGIRRLSRRRLLEEGADDPALRRRRRAELLRSMRRGPVAPVPEKANEQHYELPPGFFRAVLGPHLKYSSCFWSEGVSDLGEAERCALELTCERAALGDGLEILELGCGWGSLSLFMAERHPRSRITAVSNSVPQRRFIESEAARRGIGNLRVITADMNEFDAGAEFDRVVSVEMFEHMRNYRELLRRVAGWMAPDGRLLVHVFCHRSLAYPFETEGSDDWMGRHFFTGGIMPSRDLFAAFGVDLAVTRDWWWDGTHYQRTAEAWLVNMTSRRDRVMPILAETYGAEAARWYHRWRVFFMAVAELFGYDGGREWGVTHVLLEHAPRGAEADRRREPARLS